MDKENNIDEYEIINIDVLEPEASSEEIEEVAIVTTSEDTVDIMPLDSEVTQTETMDYILVEEPEELLVEVDEAFVTDDGIIMPEHTHIIEEIEVLEDVLNTLGSTKEYYSHNGGYAEFQKWKDGNITENRIGYFVSLINYNGNECIEICNNKSEDVYGVTVSDSAFCGNQYSTYNVLNKTDNKANNNLPFAKVCLLGTVRVRFGGDTLAYNSLSSGDYVMPNSEGCAIASVDSEGNKINIGFKVISKETGGIGDNAGNFVVITLVPQNDNVARVMKKLEETNKGVGELKVQIGNLDDKVDANISISGRFDDLEDYIQDEVNVQLEIAQKVSDEAKEITEAAKAAMNDMTTHYNEAMEQTQMAKDEAQAALSEINKHQDNLNILAQHRQNIVGFFTDASEDGVSVGTIARTQGDVSMLKQSSKSFQNLLCHVDVYSVGNQSPTDGLSSDEAQGALGEYEYIYVPIDTHEEISYIYKCTSALQDDSYYFEINSVIYSFKPPMGYTEAKLEFNARTNQLTIDGEKVDVEIKETSDVSELTFTNEKITEFIQGKSYKWSSVDGKYLWVEDKDVSFDEYPPESEIELWYTRIEKTVGEIVYNPGTLYRLIDGLWVAVATINDNNARTTSLINQTANSLTSTITNVAGEVSTLEQTVNGFSTRVTDIEDNLSEIEQTAENIRLGVYESGGGASSLELLLSGLRNDAVNTDHVFVCEILDTTPQSYDENGLFYNKPPMWDGTKFSFDGINSSSMSDEFCYCPGAKNNTYYEKTTNGYKVYTNGNQAIASLRTRVTDAESEVESWTNFKTEVSDMMTTITQNSSSDVAELSHIVMGKFLNEVESVVNPTGAELGSLYSNRCLYSPTWDADKQKFVPQGYSQEGEYSVSSDGKYYYKLTINNNDNSISGYKKYEMKTSEYASIVQKVEDGKSYIGLVAGNDKNMGSIVAQTINDRSEVNINADKINLYGTTTFADILNPGTTTISGNYIRTGIMTSENFDGIEQAKVIGYHLDTENNKLIFGYGDPAVYTSVYDLSRRQYYVISTVKNQIYYFVEGTMSDGATFTKLDSIDDVIITEGTVFSLSPFQIVFINKSHSSGMMLDLNNGTIYSKNLTLDTDGNLSIAGQITATSGYIGDDINGFIITKGNPYYYLSNRQTSLDGGYTGNPGVYIGPDGIGLGNGYFNVDNYGKVFSDRFMMQNVIDDVAGEGYSINMTPSGNFLAFGIYHTIDSGKGLVYINRGNTVDFFAKAIFHSGYTSDSDSRLKTNIENANISATELLNQIELKSFDWIETNNHVNVGIIAQQLEKVLPDLVTTNEKTGLKSISMMDLVPYLIKAVQELSAIVNPPVMTLQLDDELTNDTHWIDDMTEDEKQYYVELNKPPRLVNANPHITENTEE